MRSFPQISLAKEEKWLALLSALVACLFIYVLFFYVGESARPNEAPIGEIISVKKIKQRHSGSLSWRVRSGVFPVYLKDVIYVPKDAAAIFKLDGEEITIPENTLVQLDSNSLESIKINLLQEKNPELLKQKKWDLLPRGMTPKRAAQTPAPVPAAPKPLIPEAKETPKPAQLPSLADIEAMLNKAKDLKEKRKDLTKKKEREQTVPVPPPRPFGDDLTDYWIELISPKKEEFDFKSHRWMKLSWKPIPLKGVEYSVEISKDEKLSKVVTYPTSQSKALVLFEEPAKYYWRVKAKRGGSAIVSELSSFVLK